MYAADGQIPISNSSFSSSSSTLPTFSVDVSSFTYTPCYCEENVYLLCKKLCKICLADPHGSDLFVVFISNEDKQVPLWRQKASKRNDGLIIWDYHVICIQKKAEGEVLCVWDLDSSLPFPSPLNQYVAEAFRPSSPLRPNFLRLFRVVHFPIFLRCFASDRRHMKTCDGKWISPPPAYEPILAEDGTLNNLSEYLAMRLSDVKSNVRDRIEGLFSEKYGVVVSEEQLEIMFSNFP